MKTNATVIVWLSLFTVLFVFALQFLNTIDEADLGSTSIAYPAEEELVIAEEPARSLSRLELLRLLSDEFYATSFVENDTHFMRQNLWQELLQLEWVQDGQLIGGELPVDAKELDLLLSAFWASSVSIDSGEVTDKGFQAVLNRISVQRNKLVITRGRALELSLDILKGFDHSQWSSADYSAEAINFDDVEDAYFVPALSIALQQEWLPRHWQGALFKPEAAVTKQEALALVFDTLQVSVPEGTDRADFAFEKGLILRTEIGAYRLGKLIKYGEFKRLLLEASRLFAD